MKRLYYRALEALADLAALIAVKLYSVAERSFRFERMKYDFYRLSRPYRLYKLTNTHLRQVEKDYPTRYKNEYLDFTAQVSIAMGVLPSSL